MVKDVAHSWTRTRVVKQYIVHVAMHALRITTADPGPWRSRICPPDSMLVTVVSQSIGPSRIAVT